VGGGWWVSVIVCLFCLGGEEQKRMGRDGKDGVWNDSGGWEKGWNDAAADEVCH